MIPGAGHSIFCPWPNDYFAIAWLFLLRMFHGGGCYLARYRVSDGECISATYTRDLCFQSRQFSLVIQLYERKRRNFDLFEGIQGC